jgi:hypothetical protein
MPRKRACLARKIFVTVFAAALAACGKVDTSTNPGDNTSAVPPTITTQPVAQSVNEGATATFTVEASGSTPLNYQWQKDGADVPGATGATLNVTPTVADNGSMYRVTVSNTAGSVQSEAAKLTVMGASAVAPTIAAQPANQTVTAGQTATFSVTADGTAPLSYQWLKNGAAIAGATATSFTTPATTTADSGSVFAVTVSNSAGSVTSANATLTVNPSNTGVSPTITTQPADQTASAGQTATFTVVATGTAPLSYQWRKNGTAISGATGTSYTTPALTSADSGATFSVVVTNAVGSVTSRSAVLTVSGSSAQGTDVVTYKYDMARTGLNPHETKLTTTNVNANTFGLKHFLSTDGKVDGQPLYLSALNIGGTTHNVVFATTENGSVYAFDADSGAQLWKVSLIPAGETTSDARSCDEIVPMIGITATPVIDRGAGPHGTIYVIAMSVAGTTYHQRLHALDVTTGAELLTPTDIKPSFNASGGPITFDPAQYVERTGMLLLNHTIYTAWTSHCDNQFYTGWIVAFSQSTLQQSAVLNVAPNSGGVGPAIWMGGGGLAADNAGNIYLITANGAFETTLDGNGFPNMGDYGNSFLKLSTAGGALSVADYFAVSNTVALSSGDWDLGSGGIMLLPDQSDSGGTVRHLAVGAGKDGNIYLVNRDAMGHFSASTNNIWQQVSGALGNIGTGGTQGGIWGTPAYFNGRVYYGARGDFLTAWGITAAKLPASASAHSPNVFPYPGTSPSVSANGTSQGIVWAHQNGSTAVLYAYDANNIGVQLYSSATAPNGRDQYGAGYKWNVPVVADGHVFIGATNGVAVYGLLN